MAYTKFSEWYKSNKQGETEEERQKRLRDERLSKQGFGVSDIPEGRDSRLATSGFSTNVKSLQEKAAEAKIQRQAPLFDALKEDARTRIPTPSIKTRFDEPIIEAKTTRKIIADRGRTSLTRRPHEPPMTNKEADDKEQKIDILKRMEDGINREFMEQEPDTTTTTVNTESEKALKMIRKQYETDQDGAMELLNEYRQILRDDLDAEKAKEGIKTKVNLIRAGIELASKGTIPTATTALGGSTAASDAMINFLDRIPVFGQFIPNDVIQYIEANQDPNLSLDFNVLDFKELAKLGVQGTADKIIAGQPLPKTEISITPANTARFGGTVATIIMGSAIGASLGKSAITGSSVYLKSQFPKMIPSLNALLSRLHGAGISAGAFRAFTGMTEDKFSSKDAAIDSIAGYGVGLLFGVISNQKAVKEQIKVAVKVQKDGFFKDVDSLESLLFKRQTYENAISKLPQNATREAYWSNMKKEYDGILAAALNSVDAKSAVEVMNSAVFTKPSIGMLTSPAGQTTAALTNWTDKIAKGGLTVDMAGHIPSEGFAIAVSGYEKQIPLAQFNQEILADYLSQNEDKLSEAGHFLGGWVQDDTVFLDISRIEPDKAKAILQGKKQGELAIFDLSKGEEISTGIGEKTVTVRGNNMKKLVEDDGTIIGYHYSPISTLKTVDPEQMGTSVNAGREMNQFEDGKIREGFLKKSNFFTKATDGQEPHRFGMNQKYEVKIDADDIYDRELNPLKLKTEKAIQEAGFKGYMLKGQLRMFEEIPVTHLGKSNIDRDGKPIGGKSLIPVEAPKAASIETKVEPDAIVPETIESSSQAPKTLEEQGLKLKGKKSTPFGKIDKLSRRNPDFVVSELGAADQRRLAKYNNLLADSQKKDMTKTSRLAIMDLIETKESIPALKEAQKTLVKTMRERQKQKTALTKEAQKIVVETIKEKQKQKTASIKATQAKKDLARKESTANTKINKAKTKAITNINNMLKKSANFRADYQDAIHALTDGLDTKKLTSKHADELKVIRVAMLKDPMYTPSPQMLTELERLEKTAFRDMSIEDIQKIETAVKIVVRHVQIENKLIAEGKLRAVETVTELTSNHVINLNKTYKKIKAETIASVAKGKNDKEKNFIQKLYSTQSDSPFTLAHRLGPAMEEVEFDELLIGTDKQYKVEYTAVDKISALHDKYNLQSWYSTKPKDLFKIKLSSGDTIEINKQTRIGFQMAWNDEQARVRLLEGGFTFKDFDTEVMKITPGDFQNIVGDMTPAEKEFINEYYAWNKETMKEGNRVSLSLDGNDVKFTNEKYYGIRTSPLSLQGSTDPAVNARGSSIENRGVFRERVNSKKPIVIVGGVDSWFTAAKEMSAYIGMAIPLRNAKMMLRQPDMKNLIVKAYGKDYYDSMESYVRDIELQAVSPSQLDTFASKMLAHSQAAAIIGNIGIMVKQAVSLLSAGTEIPMKYLLKGLSVVLKNPKRAHKIAVESSAMKRKRFEGYATPELRNLQDSNLLDTFVTGKSRKIKDIFRVKGVGEKIKTFESAATKGIKIFDEVTILAIDEGARQWLSVKNPLWSRESIVEEGARFSDKVTATTQPNAGALFKPELTRSKSVFVKGLTQFTNQALQQFNIGKRTKWDYTNSKKTIKDKKDFLRKMSLTFIATPMVIGAIDTARRKLRGEDVDFKDFIANSVFAAMGSLPLATPFRFALQRGENVQSTMSAAVLDLIIAIGKTPDAIIERDFDKFVQLFDAYLNGLAPFAGIPYRRIKRTALSAAEAISSDLAFQLDKMLTGSTRTDEYSVIFEAAKDGTNLKAAQTALKDLREGTGDRKKVTIRGIRDAIDSRNSELPIEERLTSKELQPYLESLFEFTEHPQHPSMKVIKVGNDFKNIPEYWFKEDKFIELEKRGVSRGVVATSLTAFKLSDATKKQDRMNILIFKANLKRKVAQDFLRVWYGYEF